ncbi:uncharacterized protein LOC118733187 [Rhagoletis pomonella]|uniref:uncharacterized protein LOC118733187 n=1 Tax=Rhagoletis pomonella TaxID=28610 RepID=UPI00178390E9|nr:uncharacterized protein LOC118733187 [Rhagoletis pomonella]
MRLRGRLQQAHMPFNERCPIVMPKRHPLTSLIVHHAHKRCLHGGKQATLGYVRRQFWVIDGRTEVKRVIRSCVKCYRHSCTPQKQMMGDLPAARYTVTFPFMHTGVDYVGPFNIRATKGRGHKSYKGYVALFVCLASKGIHLEMVSDMTTQSFIHALERFVAARGICSDMYSDRGTTFVGADALMKEELKEFRKQLDAAASYASRTGINWHFIPPGAPNFGVLWEAGVKSMKALLKRTINTTTLTFEEFYTVLKRVESCLNSRPLTALTDDPTDFAALTPGHMLIGRALTSVPEPNLLDTKSGVLYRWKQLSQIYQDFWRRWSVEYLHHLQVRSKWHKQQPNVKVGELVLVRDEKAPPTQWKLARITDTHPGSDGLVRVVSLKTATTAFQRPISKISVLPIPTETPKSSD